MVLAVGMNTMRRILVIRPDEAAAATASVSCRYLKCAFRLLSQHAYFITGVAITGTSFLVLRYWFAGGVCRCTKRMDGKTVIITGANSGIGKETARDLARRGARVIMACRDMARSEEVAEELRASTGNEQVLVSQLDLASIQSVHGFAREIAETEGKIDVLINNAGRIRFNDINMNERYDSLLAHCQSKLANVLFTRELAQHLQGAGVTVNAVHPGLVWTNMLRSMMWHQPLFIRLMLAPFYFCLKTPKQGAQTSIHCAVAPDLEGVTGQYFSDCVQREVSYYAQDACSAKALWDMSLEMVALEVSPSNINNSLYWLLAHRIRRNNIKKSHLCVY
ncbi:retinol dehydrogenase 12-like isoform X2 [Mobula hypostoma]|uniref:retinol dehydrogenase 12-like isoform X2 n=1 Tax=Mobula hypostoma TaxID=723540 RepID=UPI002FC2FB25